MDTIDALKKELAEKEADLQKLTSELSDFISPRFYLGLSGGEE